MFAEDNDKIQPDEFFGVFDQFLTFFADGQLDLIKFRKQREEEERRAKMEAQVCIHEHFKCFTYHFDAYLFW